MSNSSVSATVVFALFAFLFIGVMLAMAFVLDRRRVKDVHGYIPERSEGAFHDPQEDEPHVREVHTAEQYEAERERREHGAA